MTAGRERSCSEMSFLSSKSQEMCIRDRRNGKAGNRLGFTVSNKLGCAVVRNRVRRKLREIYRLNEGRLCRGHDLVVVARSRSVGADYWRLEREFLKACAGLGLLTEENEE